MQPTFDTNKYWNDTDDGSGVAYTSNEDEPHSRANPPTTETAVITTAEGIDEYNVDWKNTENSENPERTAVKLLHATQKMIDTWRWYAMRWLNNAISQLSRACGLDVEGTCKLLRELRKNDVASCSRIMAYFQDRRHAKDNTSARNELKETWIAPPVSPHSK